MYKEYGVPPVAPMDPMSLDATPDADAGKMQMYKANSGLPYSEASVRQKALDVGAGMPAGSVSHKAAYDPHYPMKR